MSKDKKVKNRKNPRRKEHASRKPRAPRKPMDEQLKELQAFINSQYHAP